jgi:two-component sensor histidine kinase
MDKALLSRVEKQAWFHKHSRGLPLLLFFLVSLGTLLSVFAIERANRQREELLVERNLTEIVTGIERRASENIAILKAGAAFFAFRDSVSPQDFQEFASGLRPGEDYHGSLGIGWAKWIAPTDIAAFEAEKRAEGNALTVYPRPEVREIGAVPVVYIDPPTPLNRNALGFNMYSDPVRREAMNAAARLRQPVATGKVHLVQDKGNPDKAGFVIYMPVFQQDASGRRLKGFVYSPFRTEEFLESASESYRGRRSDITVYDGTKNLNRLLAGNAPTETDTSEASAERSVTVGERTWIISLRLKQRYALSPLSMATLVFGIIIACLVMLVARLVTKRANEDRVVLEWLTNQAAIRTSLTRELNHRVKNTLANVLSIISLTRRRAGSIDDFADSLTGRVRALSATHDLLSQTDWSNAPIGEVIGSELAPYMQDNEKHVEITGPNVSLAPNDALSLGLAVHELATNAAKYGALSTNDGRVSIEWRLLSPELVEVHWREEGGPPVNAPQKRGFGRELIEKIVAQELKAEVELEFKPAGVECRLRVPVRRLSDFALRARKDEARPPSTAARDGDRAKQAAS